MCRGKKTAWDCTGHSPNLFWSVYGGSQYSDPQNLSSDSSQNFLRKTDLSYSVFTAEQSKIVNSSCPSNSLKRAGTYITAISVLRS